MTPRPALKEREWDQSFRDRQNFVFYPHEEVIRFVSRYFRRRVGLDAFEDRTAFSGAKRSLDLGCGMGRHVAYLHDVGFESHGVDVSRVAVELARQFAASKAVPTPDTRILHASAASLPWDAATFQCVVSHGVLDSMPLSVAKAAAKEIGRVTAPGGLAYVDLISSDDHPDDPRFTGEEVLTREHERGTIQSYFDPQKIEELFEDSGLIVQERVLVQRRTLPDGPVNGRYHLVLAPHA